MVGNSLNIFQKIRKFLLKIINKDFLIFLCFLFLSGFFWLSLTFQETYEREINVSLRLTDVPRNVVLTSEIDSTIRVVIKDKGYILAPYTLDEELIRPLTFDFKQHNKQSNSGEVSLAEIQKLLSQQLTSSTKILSIKANNLTYTFNYGQRKKVPVELSGNVTPAEGYYLSYVRFTPDSVWVYAEEELLNRIATVQTEHQEISDFAKEYEQSATLRRIKNAKIVPNVVTMRLFPDILIEESVEVPIEAINVPEDKVMRIFPGKAKVVFAAGAKRVKDMRSKYGDSQLIPTGFKVVADYNTTQGGKTDKCRIALRSAPNGIRNAQLTFGFVDYLIEQR